MKMPPVSQLIAATILLAPAMHSSFGQSTTARANPNGQLTQAQAEQIVMAFNDYAAKGIPEAMAQLVGKLSSETSLCVAKQKMKLIQGFLKLPEKLRNNTLQFIENEQSGAASQKLKLAQEGGYQVKELLEVNYLYPFTRAGREAKRLAANRLLDRGDYDKADWLFDELLSEHKLSGPKEGDLFFRALIAKKRSGQALADGYERNAWEQAVKSFPMQFGGKIYETNSKLRHVANQKVEFISGLETREKRLLGEVEQCDDKSLLPFLLAADPDRISEGHLGTKYENVVNGAHHACAIATDKTVRCWGVPDAKPDRSPKGKVETLVASHQNTCAIMADKTVQCWGESFTDLVQDGPKGKIESVIVRSHFACAVLVDKTVQCWGSGTDGHEKAPKEKVESLVGGVGHICAIMADKTMQCWGGIGGEPARVPKGKVESLVAGYQYTCAIMADKTVECWGGIGGEPARVPKGKVESLVAGHQHTCAIMADKTVECWRHSFAELEKEPKEKVDTLVAGLGHTCALLADKTVQCWGHPSVETKKTPIGKVDSLVAGLLHTCAIMSDRTVQCWGHPSAEPGKAPAGKVNSVSLGVGGSSTCVIQADKSIKCWSEYFQVDTAAKEKEWIPCLSWRNLCI